MMFRMNSVYNLTSQQTLSDVRVVNEVYTEMCNFFTLAV